MKSRLTRPLLAAVVSGALLAGGLASPASAAPVVPPGTDNATATAEPTQTTTEPQSTDTVVPPPVGNPAEPDPDTDPTTTAEPTTTSAPPSTGTPTSPDPIKTTTEPDPTTTTGPAPDTKAPTGKFSIDRWSVWVGQQVTVKLVGIADDKPAAEITRTINWGDGTSTQLYYTWTTIKHQYTKAGKMPITLTLKDKAGNTTTVKSAGPTIVTPGKFKVNKAAVWHGEKFTVQLIGVPAGTTNIVLYWGDGRTTTVKGKNQTVTKWYWTTPNGYLVSPGAYTLRAVYSNKYGKTIPLYAGKISLKRDAAAPVVKLTKPKKPSKLSSWKAVKGTATDKGSGIRVLQVIAMRANSSGTVSCYTAKKKWVTLRNDGSNIMSCIVNVKVSKGKWSLALKGMKKGAFSVGAIAADWSDNTSREAEYTTTLK